MLIPSKLSRPVRLDHTVVRERLLAKLSGANNFRLALITSPAGYGKTTLISQWAAGKNDIGWYSLDEGDNQQERFISLPPCNRQPTVTARYVRRWRKNGNMPA
ncbi:TPA: hypothetical protein QI004_002452 [Escherichia coli]|nr:hypothetical protein [Escherichia coli]